MSRRFLVIMALPLALAGCRKPGVSGPTRVGYVNLSALTALHPAWAERDSLTALIASAHQSHQHPIPPFRVPPDPSLPTPPPEVSAADPAERARMEQVIQSRIDRDFAAVQEKMEREVGRFRETELATAEREIRLQDEQSQPAFIQQYQAIAAQYANRIAPLALEEIGLRPHLSDALLLFPEQRQERAMRLASVQNRITKLYGDRDAALAKLQVDYLEERTRARQRRLTEADTTVRRYRQERLGELAKTRARQRQEIQADLERSMQLRIALPEITPPLPGPTAEAARQRASATSASALTTMDRYHEAARDIEHRLYVQREELERTITDATRTAVLQLAQNHRIDVRFTSEAGVPDVTREFGTWLRALWRARAARA